MLDPAIIAVVVGTALLAFAAWYGTFFVFPACQRSLFRYSLWRVRDEAYDAIARGQLPRSPITLEFVNNVEGAISGSDGFRFLPFVVTVRSLRREEMAAVRKRFDDGMATMSPEQRALFDRLREAHAGAILRHAFTGSVPGMVALCAFNVANVVVKARQGVDGFVRALKPTLAPMAALRVLGIDSTTVRIAGAMPCGAQRDESLARFAG